MFGLLIRKLGRPWVERLAAWAARDDLFEKPGERPHQAPLSAARGRGTRASGLDQADGVTPASRSDGEPGLGVRPADLDRIRAALGPGAVRVVNHWATWCDPCVEELPLLVRAARPLGEAGVELLGVSWDLFDSTASAEQVARDVERFAQAHGLSWPLLLVTAKPAEFFAALDITWQRIPQTWLVDQSGGVVHRVEGILDEAGVADLVRRAVELSR